MASDRTLKAKAYLSNPSFQTSGNLSTVLRGVGIASIVKTSTEGLVDTYTITYTDGRTQTYEVTNGAQGERGPRGDKGPRGYTGFSAYDYAVNGGYEGTEEEFTQLMASNATMAETVEYYSWTEEIKTALMACFENVAWVNPDGQTYYDALYAALYDRTWSVENVLTGCRNTNTMTAITKGRPYNGILEALGAYTMDGATVSITMGGVDVTESVYTDGVIAIPAVTGNVVITAEAVRTAWSVTNVLTNVTSDNPAEWVAYGAEYTATLTIPEGYEMRRLTITMGGEDVSTYYSSGVINIPAVTGDVVITATATEVSDALYDWDLTESLTDKVQGQTAITNASFSSGTGLVFNALDQYCNFGEVYARDRTYEVDVVSLGAGLGNATTYPYRRLFLFDTDDNTGQGGNGFICCRKNRYGWYFYCGSAWDSGAIVLGTSSDYKYNYFNGKTIKFYLSAAGKMAVYEKTIGADDSTYTYLGTSGGTIKNFTNGRAYFGGSADGLANATLSGFRVYEGEH